jgi:hypothetical protein
MKKLVVILLTLTLALVIIGCTSTASNSPSPNSPTPTSPAVSNTPTATNSSQAVEVSGIVIEGGDTTHPGGPLDTPRRFVYKIEKADHTFINIAYTAYPPSPVGDAARAKILLQFRGGSIQPSDILVARGTYDKDTNTVNVANQGDFIVTYATEETAKQIAADFIQNTSTFQFDGLAGSVKLIQTDPGMTSSFRSTQFTFEFQTGRPGHGDRTGRILAQVITGHKAVIVVNLDKGTVIRAICDDAWDLSTDKPPQP